MQEIYERWIIEDYPHLELPVLKNTSTMGY